MLVVDLALSVITLSVCFYAMISDIKTGKVANKALTFSGVFSLFILLIKILIFNHDDLFLYLETAGIMLLFSVAGYLVKFWAGGDCKLIALIAITYPTLFYVNYNQNRVTLWSILIIAFIIGFIYLIIDSVIETISKKSLFDKKQIFQHFKRSLIMYLRSLVYLVALNQIYTYFISPYFRLNNIAYFFVSFILVYGVNRIKILGNIWVIIACVAFDLVMIIFTRNLTMFNYWGVYILILFLMLLRAFMHLHNYKAINTSDVSEGMVLSKIDTIIMNNSRIHGLPNISDETLSSRLTAEEAKNVKKWGNSKYGKTQVLIVR
ncbi:MAG: hypothetical protein IKS19_04715 [Clostridia bacterium]|nr:hypothetical protein [Clostridia bacterium]